MHRTKLCIEDLHFDLHPLVLPAITGSALSKVGHMLFVPDISTKKYAMLLDNSVGVSIPTTILLGNDKAVAQPTFGLFVMRYRRAKTPGATYFFTVVTFRRRKILCEPENRELLRTSFRIMKSRHPFIIDAIVLLPGHLHCAAG